MLSGARDAYGASMEAAFRAGRGHNGVVERDDGWIEAESTFDYLAPFRAWMPHERRAMRRARGRVLDVGCGAGRVSLHLQERGHEVVAIDVSQGACRVSRERGVRDVRPLAVEQIRAADGPFDTVVMYGNNLGLLRDATHGPWLLKRLAKATSPSARILGGNLDVYRTDEPAHLAYQERNRRRSRMSGQIRLRIRYREKATPWFDYLFMSIPELEAIATAGGWRIADVMWNGDGPMYVAVLEKG
ncbi:MAG: class I SAM-dependent methyltransferase [Planctomycetaceae bacterium]